MAATVASSSSAGALASGSAAGSINPSEEKPGLKVPKKDNHSISDLSMLNLAKAAGYSAKLFMLLNIPSATIVRERAAAEESIRGNNPAAAGPGMQGQIDNSAAQKLMLYWKKMKIYAKEKEMVDELVNALRDAGKANCADKVNEKFQLNEEIGPDDIPK